MNIPQFRNLMIILMLAALTSVSFAQRDGSEGGSDSNGNTGNTTEVVSGPDDPANKPQRRTSPGYRTTAGTMDNFGHTYADTSFTGLDISTTGTSLAMTDLDDGIGIADLYTPFSVYGNSFSQLAVSSNGYISTDTDDPGVDWSTDCPIFDPDAPGVSSGGGDRIYPHHDDLVVDGGVYYEWFDTCPRPADSGADTGCHMIMWDNAWNWSDSPADNFDVWAILYDQTWEMVFQRGARAASPSGTDVDVSIGLMNASAANQPTDPNEPLAGDEDFLEVQCDLPLPTNGDYALWVGCEFYVDLNGFDLTVTTSCNERQFDVYAYNNGVYTLAAQITGSQTVDVSDHPDSFFFVVNRNADPATAASVGTSATATVPTLGEWGMIAFLAFLALSGLYFVRKSRLV